MIADYYYYQRLSAKEKEIYKEIYAGIEKHLKSICIKNKGYTEGEVQAVFNAITRDNPHLFYLDQQRMLTKVTTVNLEVIPFYYYDEVTQQKYSQIIQRAVNKILKQACLQGKSEYEKIKILHDILSKNVEYDYDALNTSNKQKEIYAHTILGVFVKKKAVCEGIAKAFKILLNSADVKCIVVDGKACIHGKYEGHAWNIVKIAGEAYHLDSTWDICNSKDGIINYDYFNLTDKDISVDHKEFTGVPKCASNQYNYFDIYHTRMTNKNELEKYIKKQEVRLPCELYIKIDFGDGGLNSIGFETLIKQVQQMIMDAMNTDGYPVTVSCNYNCEQRTIRAIANIRV